jgi:hypothetical protein
MRVTSFHAENFLSFDRFELVLRDELTVIVGPNGAGKSNVLRIILDDARPGQARPEICPDNPFTAKARVGSPIYPISNQGEPLQAWPTTHGGSTRNNDLAVRLDSESVSLVVAPDGEKVSEHVGVTGEAGVQLPNGCVPKDRNILPTRVRVSRAGARFHLTSPPSRRYRARSVGVSGYPAADAF